MGLATYIDKLIENAFTPTTLEWISDGNKEYLAAINKAKQYRVEGKYHKALNVIASLHQRPDIPARAKACNYAMKPAGFKVAYVMDPNGLRLMCSTCGYYSNLTQEIHMWGKLPYGETKKPQFIILRFCEHCPNIDDRVVGTFVHIRNSFKGFTTLPPLVDDMIKNNNYTIKPNLAAQVSFLFFDKRAAKNMHKVTIF
jgi:hypothetical protein